MQPRGPLKASKTLSTTTANPQQTVLAPIDQNFNNSAGKKIPAELILAGI